MSTSDGEPSPIDELIRPLGARIPRVVEPLQVAALLEAQGLNDKIARERYGYDDVFSLAEAAYERITAMAAAYPADDPSPRRARRRSQLVHGFLYGLPAALLPAASALVGARSLVPALVLTTGMGWVLGCVAALMAYSLAGRGYPRSAGRVLRGSLTLGVIAVMIMTIAVAMNDNGPVALIPLCATQMAFQLASGILLFHRRELWLIAMMLPGVVAGLAYVCVGHTWAALLAICLGVICVSAVVGAAVGLTLSTPGTAPNAEPPLRTLIRPDVRALTPSLIFTTLAAAFLLQAEARYVLDRVDLAVAGAGLVLGMGVLEYRAHAFEDETRLAIRGTCYPADFTRRGRWLLAKGVLACLVALSALAMLPLTFLHLTHTLSEADVAMAVGHVAVGGGYFLAFLLANQAKAVHLCLVQAAALVVHPVGRALLPEDSPLADVLLFLGAALLFFLVLLALMSHSLRDVKQYR